MKINNHYSNIKKIMTLALPTCSANLLSVIANFITLRFVAEGGKFQLAAAALAITTVTTILTMLSATFGAVSILIRHYEVQQKSAIEVGNLVKSGFFLAVLLAIPFSIVLWNIEKLLIGFGQDLRLVLIAKVYFHFAAILLFPALISCVISQFYIGIGRPQFILCSTLFCFPLAIGFSYGFIFGKFSLPKLGLGGVPLALFITQSIFVISVFIYLFYESEVQKYKLFDKNHFPCWADCKALFKLGIPIGVQNGGELAATAVITYFMGYLGANALAASQIVTQYSLPFLMLALAVSQTLSVLVSDAYSKNDFPLVKQYLLSALFIHLFLCGLIFIVFIFTPTLLANFFMKIHDQNIIFLAKKLFIVSAVMILIAGLRNIFSDTLRGLHDSKAPMKIGVACIWSISIPISYCAAFVFHEGAVGLRIGFLSGFIIAVIILAARIKKVLA